MTLGSGAGWDAGWDKAAWRAWARRVRRGVRGEVGERLDAAVAEHVLGWERYAGAEVVAVYLAFGDEVDLAPVIARAWASGKVLAAPRAGAGGLLTLHALGEGVPLERHALGQLEPPAAAAEVAPEDVDVALVPGLVFDERGYRLGYGRGYYDRLLPRLRPDAASVGVAPAALVVPALPAEAHDARVGHLVSELGVRPVRAG